MADKQISDLTSASALTDGSLFVLEQAGAAMKANWGMMKNYISPGVAAQYSSSATYDVGDYVIYNGNLYRCTTPITTAETWTAAHWTATVLGDDVGDLKNAISYNTNTVGGRFNFTSTPVTSKIWLIGGKTYRVKKVSRNENSVSIAIAGAPSTGNAMELTSEYQEYTPIDSGYAQGWKSGSSVDLDTYIVIDGMTNTIKEIEETIDKLRNTPIPIGNLFDIASFMSEDSVSMYYSLISDDYIGDAFKVTSMDARNESDIEYRIALKEGVEYFITSDYYSDGAKIQIYDPDSATMAYNDVVYINNTFVPSKTGRYTVKIYATYASQYPVSVAGLYIGSREEWLFNHKTCLKVHPSNGEFDGFRLIETQLQKQLFFKNIYMIEVPNSRFPYILSDSIKMRSGVTLNVAKNAIIKLGNNINKPMLTNITRSPGASYDVDISVVGGIWDGNHENQSKWSGSTDGTGDLVVGIWFTGVSGLTLKNMTVRNTRTYAMLLNNLFDVNISGLSVSGGNTAVHLYDNGDGIHICGPIHNMLIENTIISSDDNAIALDTDLGGIHSRPEHDGDPDYDSVGEIDNVYIHNVRIYNPEHGQGMLLLSGDHKISNVTFDNITGMAPYFMVMDHWNAVSGYSGTYENITFRNINFTWWLTGVTFSFIVAIGRIKKLLLENVNLTVYTTGNSDIDSLIMIKNRNAGDTEIDDLIIENVKIDRKNTYHEPWQIIDFKSNTKATNVVLSKITHNSDDEFCTPIKAVDAVCKYLDIDTSHFKSIGENGYVLLSGTSVFNNIIISNNVSDNNIANNVTTQDSAQAENVKII